VRAFKFLGADGCAPFTRTPWRPGEWIETGSAKPCHVGVHGCLPGDLAYWVADELWEVELDGEIVPSRHKLAGTRGRLVQRIDAYPAAYAELAEVVAWRARDQLVELAGRHGADELARRFAAATTLAELSAARRDVTDDPYLYTAAALASDTASFSDRPREGLFVAACFSGHVAAGAGGDQAAYDEGYAGERAFQSAWLTERLQLV
jgi:hypothetical protein